MQPFHHFVVPLPFTASWEGEAYLNLHANRNEKSPHKRTLALHDNMSPLARGDVSVSWQRGSRQWLQQTTISLDLILKSKFLYLSADIASVGIVCYYPTTILADGPPPLARGGLAKSAHEPNKKSAHRKTVEIYFIVGATYGGIQKLARFHIRSWCS